MSEHSSETGIQFQNLNRIRISVPEQNLHQKNRQNRLTQISRKCDQSSLDSKHTQGICRPRVAASLTADINPLAFSVEIPRLKQSKQIPDSQCNNPCSYHHCSSFLSRIMNFSAVPRKPNVSRIRFSRYLV